MDAPSTNEHIPWNEEISIVFIDSVILKGAYKAKRGSTDETWDSVNNHFFMQPITEPFRQLSKNNNVRKLKSKLKDLRDWYNRQKGTKNLSAMENPEPGALYKKMHDLEEMMEQEAEDKLNKTATKAKLDAIEASNTMRPADQPKKKIKPNSSVRSGIDGSFTESTVTTASTAPTSKDFDAQLMDFMNKKLPATIDERVTEKQLLRWYETINSDEDAVATFLTNKKIGNAAEIIDQFRVISFEAFANLYCSPGLKFEPKSFKDDAVKLGASYVVALNLYRFFDQLRQSLEETTKRSDTPMTIGSLASDFTTSTATATGTAAARATPIPFRLSG
jgi:hypothetical protein